MKIKLSLTILSLLFLASSCGESSNNETIDTKTKPDPLVFTTWEQVGTDDDERILVEISKISDKVFQLTKTISCAAGKTVLPSPIGLNSTELLINADVVSKDGDLCDGKIENGKFNYTAAKDSLELIEAGDTDGVKFKRAKLLNNSCLMENYEKNGPACSEYYNHTEISKNVCENRFKGVLLESACPNRDEAKTICEYRNEKLEFDIFYDREGVNCPKAFGSMVEAFTLN